MWRRTPTIDLLAAEFALAVADGDHARAEGWLATAMAVRDREDRTPVRSAEGQYKRALQANASYGAAYYNLGLLYLDNDPFPGVADSMQRLNTAKAYFDQYKNMPSVEMKLYDERMKDVEKAIKRAQKLLKKKATP